MPIEKLESGQVVLRFGIGDIFISPASDAKQDKAEYIVLFQHEPRPIDEPCLEMIGMKIENWDIKMYFEKPESIDAFIHVLQDFKEAFFNLRPPAPIKGKE